MQQRFSLSRFEAHAWSLQPVVPQNAKMPLKLQQK